MTTKKDKSKKKALIKTMAFLAEMENSLREREVSDDDEDEDEEEDDYLINHNRPTF